MESNSQIGVLGGWGTPECEITPPVWFKDYQTAYATGPQGEENGDITNTKGYVYGAGAIFRKEALQNLFNKGFVSLTEDRKGASLTAGGDYELGRALQLSGYKIWYSEMLKFQHFIPKQRLTWKYIIRLHKGYLQSHSVLTAYNYLCLNDSFWRILWKDVCKRSVICLKTAISSFTLRKNMFFRYKLIIWYKIRTIFGLIANSFEIRKNYLLIKKSQWFKGGSL
jgi:hypothetical protein